MNLEQLKILRIAQELVENPLTLRQSNPTYSAYKLVRGTEATYCYWHHNGLITINLYRLPHGNHRYIARHSVDGPAYFEMTSAGNTIILYYLDHEQIKFDHWQKERLKWI